LGTTLNDHPAVLGDEPLSLMEYTSGGVEASLLGQNGQSFDSFALVILGKSVGRLPRSVDMITHLPTIGSFLNSGKLSSYKIPILHIYRYRVLCPYHLSTSL
jgi:hypothetical protein